MYPVLGIRVFTDKIMFRQLNRGFMSNRSKRNTINRDEMEDTSFNISDIRSKGLGSIFKSSSIPVEPDKPDKEIESLMKGQPVRVQIDLLRAYKSGMERAILDPQNFSGKQDRTNVLRFLRYLLYGTMFVGAYVLLFSSSQNVRSTFGRLIDGNIGDFAENVDIRFDDVQGCDEVKKELSDVVDFLKNPHKFNKLGARLPKGVLLVGPPGVGKTLLARAVAGEANVPFIFISGSNFEEVFVGLGASRVRKLFETAKSHAPCVIFIDEIDSVGRNRTSSPHHPYANQTINQLLAEMDGFDSKEGIIVLGATNQQEDLDKAILRPGRFDLQVQVSPPSLDGRKKLFKLYLSKVRASVDVDCEKLAHGTVGYTGADIENMINQATIAAGLNGDPLVTMSHLWNARDRIIMGPAKVLPVDEYSNRLTAFHEAGHALVCLYTENSIPLHKVTIIPRGQSGGHTSFLQEKDMAYMTKSQLFAQLMVSMGGRAGEEMAFGDSGVTTGSSSDFKMATDIARNMVARYGMSEKLGPRVVGNFQEESQLSTETKKLIDSEVDKLLAEALENARNILKAHPTEHKMLAEALLHFETLTKEQVLDVISGKLKPDKSLKSSRSTVLTSPFSKVKTQDIPPKKGNPTL